MSDAMTIELEGKSYAIEDFTLGELEWLEDELGTTLDEMNPNSMKAAVRFVYIIKRRENPEFTLDEARALNLRIFDDSSNGNGKVADERPTAAAKKAAAKR